MLVVAVVEHTHLEQHREKVVKVVPVAVVMVDLVMLVLTYKY